MGGKKEAQQETLVEHEVVDSKSLELQCDPKTLADYIKTTVQANADKFKLKPSSSVVVNAPSLRRDRQDIAKSTIISDLEVTPQFQRFVGTKLGDFLDKNIEDIGDISKSKEEVAENIEFESEVKLLKRSKGVIKEEVVNFSKRSRPELLAHRNEKPSSEDLSACAVSGEFVLS